MEAILMSKYIKYISDFWRNENYFPKKMQSNS